MMIHELMVASHKKKKMKKTIKCPIFNSLSRRGSSPHQKAILYRTYMVFVGPVVIQPNLYKKIISLKAQPILEVFLLVKK